MRSQLTLLALDTSSEGCSAALLVNGQIHERFEVAPRGHTRLLMPMVRELLAGQGLVPGDLDALAFACGPGSFTGLRIATGVIQGLAFGLEIPVVPVSSLATVAAEVCGSSECSEGDGVAVAFDARMGEVYWGCFNNRNGVPVAAAEECVCAPELVALPEGTSRWLAVGSGWGYREQMPEAVTAAVGSCESSGVPRAHYVAVLAEQIFRAGGGVPAEQAQPVYLRNTVTWQKLPGRQ